MNMSINVKQQATDLIKELGLDEALLYCNQQFELTESTSDKQHWYDMEIEIKAQSPKQYRYAWVSRKNANTDSLAKQYLVPPFSVIQREKVHFRRLEQSWKKRFDFTHQGREPNLLGDSYAMLQKVDTSLFSPALAEILYNWFCPEGGLILDPFAGGSVRGIVAGELGYRYWGVDIRPEQIISNESQYDNPRVTWLERDATNPQTWFIAPRGDFAIMCPPYFNLERYSDLPFDLSNQESYEEFVHLLGHSVSNVILHLKPGAFFVCVVGDIRDENGFYRGLPEDCIWQMNAFGAKLYNRIILLGYADAFLKAGRMFRKSKKVANVHQHILVFQTKVDKI